MSKLRVIKTMLLGIMIFSLTSCKTSGDALYTNDLRMLTTLVYNTVVADTLNVDEEVPINDFSNEFAFDEIRIVKSYALTSQFDYQIDPYFESDIVGKDVNIVIAILELHSPVWEAWYTQEIMIIKYNDEMTGFMAPSISRIDDLQDDSYRPYYGEFEFQSSMFMTDNAVIKYYEHDDVLYHFEIDLSDTENTTITSRYGVAKDSIDTHTESVSVVDYYKSLSSDITIDLIDKVMIDKTYVDVTITSIDDDNHLIYCSSDDVPSLQSVSFFYDAQIKDSEGNNIMIDTLNEGDTITVYYFDRYDDYQPTDIRVSEIILK